MRSRTELVTTTFIDSEDDFTETDDSEEDWRPSASNRNVKKRTHTTKGGRNRGSRKRKSSGNSSNGTHKKNRRQTNQDANYQTFDDSDDDEDEDDYEYYKARTQPAAEVEPKAIILPPKKKEKTLNGSTGVFQLCLYRKDLKEDYITNSHLCLWRKDGSNLLQKYIRIKTGVPEEFMFTSSSVYSTWDDKRRRDFINISVKCLEENHRRVIFANTTDIHTLAKTELEKVSSGLEQPANDVDDENDADAEQNSDASECEDYTAQYQQEDDDLDVECDGDNIDDIGEDDLVSEEEEEEEEEEYDDFEQLDEENEEEDDDEDKENQYESERD